MPYIAYLISSFLYSRYFISFTFYPIPQSSNLIPHTQYLIPCTLYLEPYSLYHIPYTLHLIPYTFCFFSKPKNISSRKTSVLTKFRQEYLRIYSWYMYLWHIKEYENHYEKPLQEPDLHIKFSIWRCESLNMTLHPKQFYKKNYNWTNFWPPPYQNKIVFKNF